MDESDTPSRPSRDRKRQLSEERRLEVQLRGWETGADVRLTAAHKSFFREAGASEEFLTLIEADPEGAGVNRNSVQQEASRIVFYGDLDGDPEDFTHKGGRFFTAMWDGDLYEAFRHEADMVNAILLEGVFGEDRINAARPHADAPKVSELDADRFFICSLPVGPDSS